MMQDLLEPLTLSTPEDDFEEWTEWKNVFVIHLKANEIFDKPNVVKGNILLSYIGRAALEIYDKFTFAPAVAAADGIEARDAEIPDDYHVIIRKFDEYFQRRKPDNRLRARIRFFTRLHRGKNQTLTAWIDEVRKAARRCGFREDINNDMIRDKLITTCADPEIIETALKEKFDDLSLQEVINIMTFREDRLKDAEMFAAASNRNPKPQVAHDAPKKKLIKCKWCGERHRFGKKHCPAAGSTCLKCKKVGHFTSQCFSKSVRALAADPVQSVPISYEDEADRPIVYSGFVRVTPLY